MSRISRGDLARSQSPLCYDSEPLQFDDIKRYKGWP